MTELLHNYKWYYICYFHNHDSLPLEKTLTLHNVIIRIKSAFNKNQNHYYYNMFLEKGSYQTPENNYNK